jgi:hypothetical protein
MVKVYTPRTVVECCFSTYLSNGLGVDLSPSKGQNKLYPVMLSYGI